MTIDVKHIFLSLFFGLFFTPIQPLIAQVEASCKKSFEQGVELFLNKEYQYAEQSFENTINTCGKSLELDRNLALSQFHQNKLSKARLVLERAVVYYGPNQQLLADIAQIKKALPQTFSTSSFFTVSNLRYLISTTTLGVMNVFFWIFSLVLFILFITVKSSRIKKVAFYSSISALLISLFFLVLGGYLYYTLSYDSFAVITNNTSTLRSTPESSSPKIMKLPAGLKITILNINKEWSEIELPNKKSGWVFNKNYEKI